jgi:hypothetical protein
MVAKHKDERIRIRGQDLGDVGLNRERRVMNGICPVFGEP